MTNAQIQTDDLQLVKIKEAVEIVGKIRRLLMTKRFSILLVVLTIVSGLIGGAITGRIFTPKVAIAAINQDKKGTWEYGVFSISNFQDRISLENNLNSEVYAWSVSGEVIVENKKTIEEFMNKIGCNPIVGGNQVFMKNLSILLSYLGSQGWELVDYDYNIDRNNVKDVYNKTENTKYIFKRSKEQLIDI